MASADDEQHDESGRSGAQSHNREGADFGPPVSESPSAPGGFGSAFGPALNEFGPPLAEFEPSAFGPPTSEPGPVGWAPVDMPARPNLGWQPADAPPPTVPPPPAQYRAPDSNATEVIRPQADPRRSAVADAARGPAPETQRVPAPESLRGRGAEPARSSASGFPSPPPRESSGSLWDDDELAKKLTAPRPPTVSRDSSGSLWDDDELAQKLTPPRPVAAPPEKKRGGFGVVLGVAVTALAVIVALVVLVVVFATRGHGNSKDAAHPAPPTSPAAALSCPANTAGSVTVGNGPGGTDSGPAAIMGFQHAFYSDRSGTAARTFVSPDAANVSTADTIQKAIDEQIPRGTTYCLRIEQMASDKFDVDLTEHRPDGGTTVYRQLVTTVSRGGKNLIYAIDER